MNRFTITKMFLTVVGVALATLAVSTQAACPAGEDAGTKGQRILVESVQRHQSEQGPGVQLIEIAHPAEDAGLGALGLRFQAGAAAAIDYDGIEIRYGRFGIDITGRVAACFDFREGIVVSSDMLKKGSHRLKVSITDLANNEAELRLDVRVM